MSFAIIRLMAAAAAIVLLTMSAQAQSPGQGASGVTGGDFGGSHHRRGNASKKVDAPKQKADEKGYKAALDQLPDKQYDAWHGVR